MMARWSDPHRLPSPSAYCVPGYANRGGLLESEAPAQRLLTGFVSSTGRATPGSRATWTATQCQEARDGAGDPARRSLGRNRCLRPGGRKASSEEGRQTMEAEKPTRLARRGSVLPLSTTSVVGKPARVYSPTFVPGSEPLTAGEIRVTILGSGDPWIRRSQASGSLLVEVGNEERDFFFFDLGSGALANFTSLGLPVESTTKVFLSHLHADHVGDIPGLLGSIAKAGRVDPVEIWGGGSEDPALGLAAFVEHMKQALAWDTASVRGVRPSTGFEAIAHEIPFDRPDTIYERNGVTIASFPAIHGLSGAVGYAIGYAGRKIVFSGDTRPCRHVVEAAAGADLLIHECFQSPAVFARATGLPLETAVQLTRLAHTVPEQMGKILDRTQPRMGALWHLDLTPGVDAVFEELGEHYHGPVTVSQDLTVFNVTEAAVIARQAAVDDAAPPVHGPSKSSPHPEPMPAAPRWWADALLDI
jgi:ribonuclease Z